MKISTIMVDDFYDNPEKVRDYALRYCSYYQPYYVPDGDNFNHSTWKTSLPEQRYITRENVSKLEELVGAKIDMNHFKSSDWRHERGTRWNAGFHFKTKPISGLREKGIHNHVHDTWNRCGPYGWAAVVFLTPNNIALNHNGLDIHQHKYGMNWANVSEYRQGNKRELEHPFDFVDLTNHINGNPLPLNADNDEWDVKARFKFNYNTLILHPSTEFHSSSPGWGDNFRDCRLIQTFFFKTI